MQGKRTYGTAVLANSQSRARWSQFRKSGVIPLKLNSQRPNEIERLLSFFL